MTRDKMIEELGRTIHDLRLAHTGSDAIAAAVLDLCWPDPLVWSSCNEIGHGRCHYGAGIFGHWYAVSRSARAQWYCMTHISGKALDLGYHKDKATAQAAAQAHAVETWLKQTPLGKLVGVA
jgi:hypothetical protein